MNSTFRPERRILVVDDNEAIHKDFFKILQPSINPSKELSDLGAELFGDPVDPAPSDDMEFEIDSAFQGEDAITCLRRSQDEGRPYTVAFVDMRMPPGWDGLRSISEMWKVVPDLQIVLCTAYSDYTWREIVDAIGLTDQLLIIKKPFDKVEIRQAALALSEKAFLKERASMTLQELEAMVREKTASLESEIAERKAAEEELIAARDQLLHQATHDTTTRLPNRRAILSVLEETLQVYQDEPVSLAFFDIDHFKHFNDEYGHLIGDEVLQAVGERTLASLGPQDTVGRYGGEEFLVVLPNSQLQQAAEVAERIRKNVADSPFATSSGPLEVTISLGVATCEVGDNLSMKEIIRRADEALYVAKDAGRNRVELSIQPQSA